ncbi:MAG: alpha/beta hydrolase, partial [Actinomycetota bacterium]|nr:alpha/beta hydrolase [Actinomycetota bacterium]
MSRKQEELMVSGSQGGPGVEAYRRAERAFWDRYGLQPAERFIELESPSVTLRVVEAGSGDPVLFVGGTAGTGPYWAPLVAELSGFRCLMVDRPGFGLSGPIDYTEHAYGEVTADILSGVLEVLGIERTHVAGASIGDVWALRLAQRHPSRVDRVILFGGGPLVPEIPVPTIIRLIASPIGALMVRGQEKPKRVRSILRRSGHGASLDAGRIPEEYVDWRGALSRFTRTMPNERDMVRALVRGKAFRPGLVFEDDELAGIGHPVLMVYGSEDPVGWVEIWRRFAGRLPQGELHLVDGGGHFPWYDDPPGVGRRVREFL